MKIIFLDIDGVLNHFDSYDWAKEPRPLIERDCVFHFNRIIEQTEAQIVLSSSWRYMVHGESMTLLGLQTLFRTHALRGEVIDITRRDSDNDDSDHRGQQIRDWLDDHPEVAVHVVFDDCEIVGHATFIRTNGVTGLTAADAARAIEILNG